jgi:HNH endonuclease
MTAAPVRRKQNTREPLTILTRVNIDPRTICWEWQRARQGDGYGHISVAKRLVRAHRLSYEIFRGPIPDGLTLDHLCRNRACVNPHHLEPVTCRENILRGESPFALRARKTHCPLGHEYTPANTYVSKRGGRDCRLCRAIAAKKAETRRQADGPTRERRKAYMRAYRQRQELTTPMTDTLTR